ncbi:MAG TPA: hypothetical protein VEI53_08965 [Ktedonobacteraceae bacterium]|nr:hypothetical protein [Ktedonobacteraceae bacterium]
MARIFALILGLIGVVIAFIINLLYSSLHLLGRVAGITNDQTHFFWGLFVVLIALVGSILAMFIPIAGAVLLLIAGIAFFFIAGWWALLASPFLLVGAVLAYNASRVKK